MTDTASCSEGRGGRTIHAREHEASSFFVPRHELIRPREVAHLTRKRDAASRAARSASSYLAPRRSGDPERERHAPRQVERSVKRSTGKLPRIQSAKKYECPGDERRGRDDEVDGKAVSRAIVRPDGLLTSEFVSHRASRRRK